MAAPKQAVGPKSDKIWRDAVMRAVRRRLEGKDNPQKLDKLADSLVDAGLAGDVSAIKEVGDRLDGKPAQSITGANDGPIELVGRLVWGSPEKS